MVAGCLLLVLAASAGQAGRSVSLKPVPVNDRTVRTAIDRAVAYLYSRANKDGIWDTASPPRGRIRPGAPVNVMEANWPGMTGLVLFALATAGQKSDPQFRRGVAWLMKQEPRGTYVLGLRTSLIHELPDSRSFLQVLRRDTRMLLKARRDGRDGAMWQYVPPPVSVTYGGVGAPGDYSNVNYAVLGLWAASDEGYEVPPQTWLGLERAWVQGQDRSGGWAYFPAAYARRARGHQGVVTGSMTTAGIASLYLIIDRVHARRGGLGSFRRTASYASIRKGLKWMARSFQPQRNPPEGGWTSYYYYNVERVGAAAGLKYFGRHDWFRQIAAYVLTRQRPDGSIPHDMHGDYGGTLVDTAYCLLFLAKGSAPVIFNKVRHAGDWDNHIRELAGLTDWMSRQSERPANWQVVDLNARVEELTDSRILYVAGTKPLAWGPDHKRKLKSYVQLGGMLLFHPDRPSRPFEQSVAALLADLWPELELRTIDLAGHPLGRIYMPIQSARMRVRVLASPTRVLAAIVDGAPANAWAQRRHATDKDKFALGANLHYFVNDRAPLAKMPTKLTLFATEFADTRAPTDRTVTVARVRYGDNPHRWDPEPMALTRFARLLARRERVRLRVEHVKAADMARLDGVDVALLSGVDAVTFTQAQWDGIHAWLARGGTLVVDQAGGPREDGNESFDSAFRKLMEERYGPDALRPMASSHPLLGGVATLRYRHVGGQHRRSMGPRLEHVRIDGRAAIVYSRYDLTCGLLGAPNPLAVGLMPASAYTVLSRLVLRAAGARTPASTATAPSADADG